MSTQKGLLSSLQAIEEHYSAGDYIFREDAVLQFYYEILAGEVKLNSYKEDGKEFIQDILSANECFGEAMLILGKPSPVNAVALTACIIRKISRDQFFQLLKDQPDVFRHMYESLSAKTSEKMQLISHITSENADVLLVELMDRMKDGYPIREKFSFEVPHTRKQLAALTGLSVETIIREIKKMEKNEILVIRNGKIFY